MALAVGGLFLVTTWVSTGVELLVQGVPGLPGLRVLVASGEAALRAIPGAAGFLVFLLVYRFAP